MECLKLKAGEIHQWGTPLLNRLSHEVFVTETDTVLGISGSFRHQDMCDKINNIKGRGHTNLILLISQFEQLEEICDASQYKFILEKYWPGAMTFNLHKRNHHDTVAVRLPNNPFLLELISKIGPLWSTSANRHLETPAQTVEQAIKIFGREISLYIEGGSQNRTLVPSTLVDLCGKPRVIRQGKGEFTNPLGTEKSIG